MESQWANPPIHFCITQLYYGIYYFYETEIGVRVY